MNDKEKKAFDIANACIKAAQEMSNSMNNRNRWISVEFESYLNTNGIDILPSLYAFKYAGGFTIRFSFIVFELEITFSR